MICHLLVEQCINRMLCIYWATASCKQEITISNVSTRFTVSNELEVTFNNFICIWLIKIIYSCSFFSLEEELQDLWNPKIQYPQSQSLSNKPFIYLRYKNHFFKGYWNIVLLYKPSPCFHNLENYPNLYLD